MKPQKWVYLLGGLSHPTKTVRSDTELTLSENIEDINIEEVEVRLRKVFLTEKERLRRIPVQYECKDRFVFYIKDGVKDDVFAQKFNDAVISSLALVDDVTLEESPTALCIPEDLIQKTRVIRIKDILGKNYIGTWLYFRITSAIGVSDEILDYVWRIVPAIMKNQSLVYATHFYKESITQVWVADDDVFDII